LITTKKGKRGTLALTYSGNQGWQFLSGMPKPLDAIGYMVLVNQQALHNVNGGTLVYKLSDFEDYRNGTKKSYDWYNAAVAKSFPQSQHNLSASGGNEQTTYFLSLGYTFQDGMLKSGDLNYKRFNVRSNISSRLTKNITLDLNVNGILDTKNQPNSDAWWIIRSIWRQNPLDPFYANDDPAYPFQGSVDGTNPISLGSSSLTGYKAFNNRWFQSSIALTYKIPFVEGLSAKGLYSYDYKVADNKFYQKEYSQYTYNAATGTYNKFTQNAPSTITRQFYQVPSSLSQLSLNYDHTFNGTHNVNALVLYEESVRQSDNFNGSRQLSLPVDQLFAGNALNQQAYMDTAQTQLYKLTNRGLIGRLNYGYKGKYLAEFSFRYDGSSKFEDAKQWGFFPAASVGWRISEENFWLNTPALSFINSFKLRASYGKLGDDAASSYQFVTGYLFPARGQNNRLPPGSVFDGAFVNSLQSTGIPNHNITWFVSKTFDIGLDAEAWNGLLGVSVDFFNRDRTGLLSTRTLSLPGIVGADLPQENLNSDRTQGFDLEVNHRNHIGKFNYFAKGIFSYARTMNRYVEQARAGNSYLNWYNNGNSNNRYTGVYWGYGDGGRYQSFADIYKSLIALGRGTLPGDYIMEDWNGDGEISDLDIHPISYSGSPLIQYGLTLGGSFKGFDLNVLFQGAAKANVAYFEQLNTPLWGSNRSSALEQFLNNYHPLDPTADPYDPNTVWVAGHFPYTGTVPPTNSLVNTQNGAYLRLKTAELGYTIPYDILKRIGIKGVRVYVNGYNLFTITKLRYVDPEHPSATFGYLYPLNKSVSGGIVVNF
jgi:TonB-linked SusC/RagA family outer membrane protein